MIKRLALYVLPVVVLASLLFCPLMTWIGVTDFHFKPHSPAIQLFIDCCVPILMMLSLLQCAGIFFISVGGFLTTIVGMFDKTTRTHSVKLALILLFLSFAVFFSIRLSNAIRHDGFVALASRAKTLVEAIESYQKEHGEPPTHLRDLVPGYILNVPRTGMLAYPEYSYLSNAPRRPVFFRLAVSCPLWLLNFDEFYYNPSHKIDQPGVELIGDWAYLHE